MKRVLLLVAGALLTLAACTRLLGYPDKSGPHPFEHRAHVLKGIACTRCHKGITTAGDTGPTHIPTTVDCVACHQKPHDNHECSNCHGLPLTRDGAQEAIDHLKFSHEKHMPQVRGNCVRCHSEVAHEASVLRPTMATCFGCHQHEDQFRARKCDDCHVDLPEELTRPVDHLVHDGDWVREHGVRAASTDLCASCHRETFCAGCHGQTVPALPEKLRFADTMRAGVHRAGFRSRHAEEARGRPGLCTTCHTEDTCRSCHEDRNVAATAPDPRNPHPPGWLGPPGSGNEHGRAAWRNPAECAACHSGAGESLCVGCHQEGGIGGSPHPLGWSSRLAKTELPCLLCHRGP
jgi:cytochrome c7-like protein